MARGVGLLCRMSGHLHTGNIETTMVDAEEQVAERLVSDAAKVDG